jgi:hypothetical protein
VGGVPAEGVGGACAAAVGARGDVALRWTLRAAAFGGDAALTTEAGVGWPSAAGGGAAAASGV